MTALSPNLMFEKKLKLAGNNGNRVVWNNTYKALQWVAIFHNITVTVNKISVTKEKPNGSL